MHIIFHCKYYLHKVLKLNMKLITCILIFLIYPFFLHGQREWQFYEKDNNYASSLNTALYQVFGYEYITFGSFFSADAKGRGLKSVQRFYHARDAFKNKNDQFL